MLWIEGVVKFIFEWGSVGRNIKALTYTGKVNEQNILVTSNIFLKLC